MSEGKPNRGPRSPAYPAIDLESAIQKARILKDYSPSRKPIPVDVALRQMKYTPKSGGGNRVLAALIHFGLLDDKGKSDQRVVTVTDLGFRILVAQPDSDTYKAAVKTAALSPTLHAEVHDRWPHGLPGDDAIKSWLVLEKNFNEKVVGGVLAEIRSTFNYAKVDSGPGGSDTLEGKTSLDDEPKVGDLVQWTSQGVARFETPQKIARIEEHDGECWVFIEGASGAIPMSQVKVVQDDQKDEAGGADPRGERPAVLDPTSITTRRTGMKQETSETASGKATLTWPSELTQAGYDDLEYWLQGVLRKAKRDLAAGDD